MDGQMKQMCLILRQVGFQLYESYTISNLGEWLTPKIVGDRPPPCAGFTLTKLAPNTALLHGGFEPVSGGCLPDSYIVEMDKNTMVSIM